jgi:hypothetical protein
MVGLDMLFNFNAIAKTMPVVTPWPVFYPHKIWALESQAEES